MSLFWLPQTVLFRSYCFLLSGRKAGVQRGESLSFQFKLRPLSNHIGKNKRWAEFTAWVVVCGVWWQGGDVGTVRDWSGSLITGAPGSFAAADAQVGGHVVYNALKGDNNAVHETFEGVDLISIQIPVGIVETTTHHNKEQELEQHSQEASSCWCFAWRASAASSWERLWERAALGVDDVLQTRLIQPVFTWF